MMRTGAFFNRMVLIVLLALLVGCESAPTEEVEQARAALARADSAQADLYAPEPYQDAQDALASAEEAIDAGRYDEARTLLASAAARATEAVGQAVTQKEEMRTETETLLMEAERMADLLAEAAGRTRVPVKRTALQEGLERIAAAREEARTALERGDVPAALEQARSAHDHATALWSKLEEGKAASWVG